jgi:hypothetical protein
MDSVLAGVADLFGEHRLKRYGLATFAGDLSVDDDGTCSQDHACDARGAARSSGYVDQIITQHLLLV